MSVQEMKQELDRLLQPQLIATNEGTHGDPDSWRRYLRPDGTTYLTGSGRPSDGIGYERTFQHEPSRARLPKIERIRQEIEAAEKKVASMIADTRSRYRGNGLVGHGYGGPAYPVKEDLQKIAEIDPDSAQRLESELV